MPASQDPKAGVQKFADGLATALMNFSPWQDPSAEQKQRLLMALSSMKTVARDVQPRLNTQPGDPLITFVPYDLFKQLLRLEAAVTAGSYAFARQLLLQLTHAVIPWRTGQTRSTDDPHFPDPPAQLHQLDKADYLTAIKRYNEAMPAYEELLSDRMFQQSRPAIWEKAAQNLMALTIRTHNKAPITLEICSALLEKAGAVAGHRSMLNAWRNSAKSWAAEGPRQKLSGPQLLQKAQQNADRGDQLTKQGRNFGNMDYLRALALLDELALSREPRTMKAAGFQLAGRLSEKMPELLVGMQAGTYYEACIRIHPHSAESRECLKLMESYQTQQKDALPDPDGWKQLVELAR